MKINAKINRKAKFPLIVEFIIIYIAIPALIFTNLLNLPKIVLLLSGIIYCIIVMVRNGKFNWKRLFTSFNSRYLKIILIRTIFVAIALYILVLIWQPGLLFNLPPRYGKHIVLLIILYPVFSVLPQELIYRAFFFQRYSELFPNKNILFIMSIISFSYLHIIYYNPIAVILTFIGGYFFGRTYSESGSLLLTIIEHTLIWLFNFPIRIRNLFHT